jgi:hypothetical protein
MNDEKLLNILNDGQTVLDTLITDLEKIVDSKNGPLWHPNNRQRVETAISRLKLLDHEWRASKPGVGNQTIVGRQHLLIRRKMSRVQQLISQYMLILEGSKSLVKEEIGRINKAKLIKGYRFKNSYRISSGQLC